MSAYNTRLDASKLNVTYETIAAEDNGKSQEDKMKELKVFMDTLTVNGDKATYDLLISNFGKVFIEKCKQNKILISLPDGSYEFGG